MMKCSVCRSMSTILYPRIVEFPSGELQNQMICIGCLHTAMDFYLDEREELEALK